MSTRTANRLELSAQALKQGLLDCLEAGKAFCASPAGAERQAAQCRHEEAYRRLEELKRRFLEQARGAGEA